MTTFAILETRKTIYNPQLAKITYDYDKSIVILEVTETGFRYNGNDFCVCCGRSEVQDDLRIKMVGNHEDNQLTRDIYSNALLNDGWYLHEKLSPDQKNRYKNDQGVKFDYSFLNTVLYLLEMHRPRLGDFRVYPTVDADLWLEWSWKDWEISAAFYYDAITDIEVYALHLPSGIAVETNCGPLGKYKSMVNLCNSIKYYEKCTRKHLKRIQKKASKNE